MSHIFDKYPYEAEKKLDHFPKYVRRQSLSRFLARYELFKMIMNVKGSIIEGGVHYGGGLMSWAKLSAALEPYQIHRHIYGFDTFEGFPSVSDSDKGRVANEDVVAGGFNTIINVYDELQDSIQEFDENRFLNQFNKVSLVRGDVMTTIPEFMQNNQHLVVALLFLDFDLYEPTKVALEHFLPRMPKGSILAFDEINNEFWPGETVALLEKFVSINQLEIKQFSFDPNISYMVL